MILKHILLFLLACFNSALGLWNDSRIVGGDFVTNRSDYPYVVSIQVNGHHICGGSILDYRHILTAAHCCYLSSTKPIKPKQMSVRTGDLFILTSTNDTRVRDVDKIMVHPFYNPDDYIHDIAIVRISGSLLPWNENIKPIPLARSKPDRGICDVCGWGTTKFNVSSLSYRLRSVNISIVDNFQCRKVYGNAITQGMICAGYPGKDSCQGDSGGPLVCDHHRLLTGVVSWGADCGTHPGVYTSVPDYLYWINRETSVNSALSSREISGLPTTTILILLVARCC